MGRILTLLTVLYPAAKSVYFGEDLDANVCLLQFQLNLSSFEGSSSNGIVEIAGNSRLQWKEHFTTGANKSKLLYLQNNQVPVVPADGHQVAKIKRRHVNLVWISSVMLVIAFLSLLLHVVPQLRRLSIREERNSVEADASADDVNGTMANSSVRKQNRPVAVVLYGTLYIICSISLIKYNKFLMNDDRFPYATNLTCGHQASGTLFLFILFKLRPSLYPSLREGQIDRSMFCWGMVPVAVCFSGQLVLSNVAYLYASVAFLQMMKEGNMVLVYLGSLLVGLDFFHSVRARVLLCLFLSTALTIEGQVSFSPAGFAVQGISQVMEATKIVLQSVLLSAAGTGHLDAYSYNLIIQFTTALIIGSFMCFAAVYIPAVPLAPWAEYVIWWPHLLANCCLALALNLVIALFISYSSAVGFVIAGIAKDMGLIFADVLFSGTEVSMLQYIAFGLQIIFVASYSLLKLYPKYFDADDLGAVKK